MVPPGLAGASVQHVETWLPTVSVGASADAQLARRSLFNGFISHSPECHSELWHSEENHIHQLVVKRRIYMHGAAPSSGVRVGLCRPLPTPVPRL